MSEWQAIETARKLLIVMAWLGMIAFFVFAVITVVTGSSVSAVFMIVSILIWWISGFLIICTRQTNRKPPT